MEENTEELNFLDSYYKTCELKNIVWEIDIL
jgi:hypothetical protein